MTLGSGWRVQPGAAVGPLVLGMTEPEVREAIGAPMSVQRRGGMTTLDHGFVAVMLLDGVVTMIVIDLDAQIEIGGNGIRPGMPLRDLVSHLGSPLTYDEEEGLWCSADTEGVWFEIARPADVGEDPIDPPYVPEQYDISRPESALVRRIFVQ